MILYLFLHDFGMILGWFWYVFHMILASLWDHFQDHFGIILGSFWNHFGIILVSFWDHFGIIPGSFWNDFGIILGSLIRNRFGIILGSFCPPVKLEQNKKTAVAKLEVKKEKKRPAQSQLVFLLASARTVPCLYVYVLLGRSLDRSSNRPLDRRITGLLNRRSPDRSITCPLQRVEFLSGQSGRPLVTP